MNNVSFIDMCPLDLNAKVSPYFNITWAQAVEHPVQQFQGPSYLRADVGGALLPWVYTFVVLLLHIPVVVIRVVRWQTVQVWCLVATLFTITITMQAYVSTAFREQEILTWTPLLLVIDAGSMAQVLCLVVEEFSLLTRLGHAFVTRVYASPLKTDDEAKEPDESNHEAVEIDAVTTARDHSVSSKHEELPPLFTSKPLYIAIVALLLLTTVLILQTLGLAHATKSVNSASPSVSWCSPYFQPFAVAVLDGNCNVFAVNKAFMKGIGCIVIPGKQQSVWLWATVAGTGVAMILELIDVTVLATVNSGARWRGVKMRRPWCTMIAGLVVLALILMFGVVYSTSLPAGIAEDVWVVTAVADVYVYQRVLGTAGLRGAMLVWNDGVFGAWGHTYYGSWHS